MLDPSVFDGVKLYSYLAGRFEILVNVFVTKSRDCHIANQITSHLLNVVRTNPPLE